MVLCHLLICTCTNPNSQKVSLEVSVERLSETGGLGLGKSVT
jgi:hypothetical protein